MQGLNYVYDRKRFETFFDAIVAIILTILVLELRVPESAHTEGQSTKDLLESLLPSFISYIGSFLLIVGIWIDHHVLALNLTGITKRYILMNMLFVLSLSFVPFTTAFAGHHPHDSFAVALLFGNYFFMNITFGSLYWYANWKKLMVPGFAADNRKTAIYSLTGIVLLALAIPLAYANTYLSFVLGILIFSGHLMKKK